MRILDKQVVREISHDLPDLIAQAFGDHHQYPDEFMLFLGTMFSPIEDRDAAGKGFIHHIGDVVTIPDLVPEKRTP